MQVVQTAVVPPRIGKVIFANIGSIRNSRAALTNRVSEKIATDTELRRATAECCAPMLSGASAALRPVDALSSCSTLRSAIPLDSLLYISQILHLRMLATSASNA